ncbi:hypothetical protein DL96DRAFT_1613481 [Flagelloscypha sp. PMI_526]|nr:hypothetical protein DL96DRAFT_1613481 [Flagelloscypha sp. PMI_526]
MIFWLSLAPFRSCVRTKLHLERYEVLVTLCVIAFSVSKYLAPNQLTEKKIDLIYNVPIGIPLFYLSARKELLDFPIPNFSRVLEGTSRTLARNRSALLRVPTALLSIVARYLDSRRRPPGDIESSVISLHSHTVHGMETASTEPFIPPTVVSQTAVELTSSNNQTSRRRNGPDKTEEPPLTLTQLREVEIACQDCGVKFTEQMLLNKHRQTCGIEAKTKECHHCAALVVDLEWHKQSCPGLIQKTSRYMTPPPSHDSERWICRDHNRSFISEYSLLQHLAASKDHSWCFTCGLHFNNDDDLEDHMYTNDHKGTDLWECPNCSYFARDPFKIRAHGCFM